ncbi:MAG: hypothetical protein IH917_13800 [Acidobacteria bacterium]|nr:hypothetical protein [Acidobacteriota bacterium]
METQFLFEIYPFFLGNGGNSEPAQLPWHETVESMEYSSAPLVVDKDDGLVWVKVDALLRQVVKVSCVEKADVGLQSLVVGKKRVLGLLPLRPGILVNAVPALPFSALSTRDNFLLPGCIAYVTTRIQPFVGRPPQELLGRECIFCQIPVEKGTRVVVCHCGQAVHHETADSHPNVTEEDRLCCFEQVKDCLSCSRTLTLEPHLLWDPRENR